MKDIPQKTETLLSSGDLSRVASDSYGKMNFVSMSHLGLWIANKMHGVV